MGNPANRYRRPARLSAARISLRHRYVNRNEQGVRPAPMKPQENSRRDHGASGGVKNLSPRREQRSYLQSAFGARSFSPKYSNRQDMPCLMSDVFDFVPAMVTLVSRASTSSLMALPFPLSTVSTLLSTFATEPSSTLSLTLTTSPASRIFIARS